VSSKIIKKEDFLLGVRTWVQHYNHGGFELFTYIGKSEGGVYFFQSRTQGTIIAKTVYQLNQFGFGPFVIDTERIEDAMESTRNKREGA
jgi:hypothetical protein